MTFNEWIVYVNKSCTNINTSQLRVGQNYFNSLCNIRPDLSEQIRGKSLDPFYQDERLESFLNWVGNNWDK